MRNNKLILPLLALIALVSGSCRKDLADTTPIVPGQLFEKAVMQVYNGTLNSSRNFVYLNSSPVNATTVAFGAVFPANSFGFGVGYGDNNIVIRDTSSTTTQLAQNFVFKAEPGKSYSLFTYDTITSPKRVIVENLFDELTGNSTRVRFANLIYNPTAVPNVELFSVNTGNVIIGNIPVGGVSGFTAIVPNVADTWQVRISGTTTVLATLTVGTSTFVSNRHYTVVFRGSYRAAANRGVNVIVSR